MQVESFVMGLVEILRFGIPLIPMHEVLLEKYLKRSKRKTNALTRQC